MARIVDLAGLDYGLWRSLTRLYRADPLRHFYIIYDMVYDLDSIEACFSHSQRGVEGYVFTWVSPGGEASIHVWGEPRGLEECLRAQVERRAGRLGVVQVHTPAWLGVVEAALSAAGLGYEVKRYIDMAVGEGEFRPVNPGLAVRLDPERHLDLFLRAMERRGRRLGEGGARLLLERLRYYGVILDGELVSYAARCLSTPEVWLVCDVYTEPEYRGRGLAKAATSAVTRDAIASGARALLHVEEGNEPALRVYRALGYRRLATRPWLLTRPGPQGGSPEGPRH
jgi:GNAT superfamily N-acetyltransferase